MLPLYFSVVTVSYLFIYYYHGGCDLAFLLHGLGIKLVKVFSHTKIIRGFAAVH